MKEHQVKSRLEILDSELEDRITQESDQSLLRRFAAGCAALALACRGNGDQRLSRAVEVCERYADGKSSSPELKQAFTIATRAAEQLDEESLRARQGFKKGQVSAMDSTYAFGVARAAMSASACCHEDVRAAARDAAYEAWAAVRTVAECAAMTPDGRIPREVPEYAIDAGIASALLAILDELALEFNA